jgi:acyl-CoA reductase-like NAD-dependent aldehyde dehydrogenase
MNTYRLLIGGKLVSGDRQMDVINPATGTVFARSPRASLSQLDAAVTAAKRAFAPWAAASMDVRRERLLAIAETIEANVEELASVLVKEQGKPLPQALGEVRFGAAGNFRRAAGYNLPVELLEDTERRRVECHRMPLGVVAAIVPWNVPLIMMAKVAAPALLAGNTVVVKPAPTTPLTTLRFGELIADLVPAGVMNILSGGNDLGEALTLHREVRKVAFTGSTATGRLVMANSATTLKRITLELGGNDAAIVLDDVDPAEVAPKLFASAFMLTGQVCFAIKRLYVQDAIYDRLCQELAALANRTIVGDGMEQGTQMGPLQNEAQFAKVKAYLKDAQRHGTVIAGGTVLETGYFVRPTIVRDVAEGTSLVDEEQFGPILPVLRFGDPGEAVTRANQTDYGLGASVWSADPNRAYALARQLEAGTVWVNKHGDVGGDIPFGGAKQSGMGVDFGLAGLHEFTQAKIINIARGSLAG